MIIDQVVVDEESSCSLHLGLIHLGQQSTPASDWADWSMTLRASGPIQVVQGLAMMSAMMGTVIILLAFFATLLQDPESSKRTQFII